MPRGQNVGLRAVRALLRTRGYNLVRTDHRKAAPPIDTDDHTRKVIKAIENHTLTPHGRVIALVDAVRHIAQRKVPGAVVECGVWRGGSMMAAAMTLIEQGDTSRDLYLFDTFTHMPPAGPEDIKASGRKVSDIEQSGEASPIFDYIPIDEVRAGMLSTGYPAERIHLVQGMVEDTIPSQAPDAVALCRLDTDYYESTKHEMDHLYPRISTGGALLIDDYGEFLGARKAVDQFFDGQPQPRPFFHRIDHAARLVLKP
ncbi:MAG: O-methyltransferase [Actinomycetota bacterium]|jgi:hypothetical protein